MGRSLISIVLGIALWWFLFFAVGIAFGLVWPRYREAVGFMFDDGDLSHFTTPMLLVNYMVFIVAGVAVGWLVTRISGNRVAALVLGLLYLTYMAINHYFVVWDELPAWYNLLVPVIVTGAIVLGSRLVPAGRHTSP
ncbi:MAG: hypothetical protein ACWGPN_16220 [Gammaproteobacteria bacterium]